MRPGLVKDRFVDRFKNNDWDEKKERNTCDFLELGQEIYANPFPHSINLFVDEEDESHRQ